MTVAFTPEETEVFRLERLAEAAEAHETTVEQLVANYTPGSPDCYAAMHLASVYVDQVDRHLTEHPAILSNPEWYRFASDAQTALFNLYQAIGAAHAEMG